MTTEINVSQGRVVMSLANKLAAAEAKHSNSEAIIYELTVEISKLEEKIINLEQQLDDADDIDEEEDLIAENGGE